MRVSLLKRTALLAGACFLLSPFALAQQTYTSTPGCALDSGLDPCVDTITVPGTDTGNATDVNVQIDITHTWIGDLDILITHPGGTFVELWGQSCGNDDDMSVLFDDGAGPPVCASPTVGTYDPFNPLSAFNGMSAIGDWTITVTDNVGGDTGTLDLWSLIIDGIVPVELVSFTGTSNGTDVVLNWETASETNNAGFEVQMQDGENWNALGFVDGHGTTTEVQTYAFTAGDIPIGTQAFRLKQIDFDGAFEYSGEVEVTVETPGTHVVSSAYPNPFNPQSQFTLAVAQEQHVTAELFNTLGQRVAVLFDGSVEANQSQLVTIDGAGLASGMYVVRVTGERFSDALSVTLLK